MELLWVYWYKIVIGVVRGLWYLYEECCVGCIVYCDMWFNNILFIYDLILMVSD